MDLLITLKYIYFFSIKNSFNMLNYLSRISTLRNINLINRRDINPFWLIFLNFAFKIHGTLKMLILGAQDNFRIILSYYVEGHLKKMQIWISCLPLISKSPKSWFFLETNFDSLWSKFWNHFLTDIIP